MRKVLHVLAGLALMLFAAGSAMAYQLPAGYTWVNQPFWTNTDHTTSPNGNSQFQLLVEQFGANRDSSFGLFSVADLANPTAPQKFQVFGYTDQANPKGLPLTKTVSFRENAGIFEVSLDNFAHHTDFYNKAFGFYFDFYNTTTKKLQESYFSFAALDTKANEDNNKLNVLTASTDDSQVLIYLDRDGMINTEYQMMIGGNDLAPAVPEPGTMVLLGAGMLGLAIYGKRRTNREA